MLVIGAISTSWRLSGLSLSVSKPASSTRRHRGGFQPPHCPNPDCDFHQRSPEWHFVRRGSFTRPSDGRRIQAFRCSHCGRNFSHRTFSTSYWLRHRQLLRPIASWCSEGPALRQIARVLGTSHATVTRHVARIGRHCLIFHRNLLQDHRLQEALVIDGFETFEYSQFFPFHANLAAGAKSWFIYHFTDSPLRRKGAMTKTQRQRREELETTLGRPDPEAIEKAMAGLLRPLLRSQPLAVALLLFSDDHPAYPRALRRLRREWPEMPAIDHQVTSSKERRTTSNPLFPVNLADLLLRHSSANHRRETIAFSKRRQAALERLAITVVWRNYLKKRRENGPSESAAMWLGFIDRLLTWGTVLRRRLFPAHADLPEEWVGYYWRKVRTVVLGDRQIGHTCRFAF